MRGYASIVETEPNSYSLLLKCGTTKLDNVIRETGFEPDGYFWNRLAQFIVEVKAPALAGRLHYDCESSMFCAYGTDQAALKELCDNLNLVIGDEEYARGVLQAAKEAGGHLDS